MRLGIKIKPELYEINPEYRERVKRFDVWYVEAKYIQYRPKETNKIYRICYEQGKEMYGYFLVSSRIHIANEIKDILKVRKINENDVIKYLKTVIRKYPQINNWEICHEAINDKGDFRRGNVWYRNLGEGWETLIYELIKDTFPDKNFFYGDYIRNNKKANSIIEFVNSIKSCSGFNFQIHSDICNPIHPNLIRLVFNGLSQKIKYSLETTVWNIREHKIDLGMTPRQIMRGVYKNRMTHLYNINRNMANKIQANHYSRYKKLCDRYGVDVFGIWCLVDIPEDYWIYEPWHTTPGLLDSNFKKKDCYSSIF